MDTIVLKFGGSSVADNDKNIRQTGVLTDFVTYTVARIVVE